MVDYDRASFNIDTMALFIGTESIKTNAKYTVRLINPILNKYGSERELETPFKITAQASIARKTMGIILAALCSVGSEYYPLPPEEIGH
jgi:hypothetical protein